MALPYDDGARIVPLLSHSNVRRINDCPHDDSIGPCPPGTGAPGDECVLWYAGRDVEVGEELCTRLGPLLPDAALLQHGVLLRDSQAAGEVGIDRTGGAASVLHGLDRAGYDDSAPFTPPRHNQEQEVLAKGSAGKEDGYGFVSCGQLTWVGGIHTHPQMHTYICTICLAVFRCLFLSLLVCLSVCLSVHVYREMCQAVGACYIAGYVHHVSNPHPTPFTH